MRKCPFCGAAYGDNGPYTRLNGEHGYAEWYTALSCIECHCGATWAVWDRERPRPALRKVRG